MEPTDALSGLHVLVVDDEADSRELLATILAYYGSCVSTAKNAEEGLMAVERGRPDVLLSDICMPGKDGCDFLRAVRALPAECGGRTPAAAVTAMITAADKARVAEAGFAVHLSKPLDFSDLVATVALLANSVPRGA